MNTAAVERPNKIALGAFFIVFSMFMTAVQDVIFKNLSLDFSLWQIFLLRSLFSLPLIALIAFAQKQGGVLFRCAVEPWSLLRSFFMVLMYIAMYSVIPFLSLSIIAAGIYTSPIFITLLSATIVGERVSLRGWCAVMIGFVGMLVILQPGMDDFSFLALVPILTGLCYAIANIITRSKCYNTSTVGLVFSLNFLMGIFGAVLSAAIFLWQPSAGWAKLFPFLINGWVTLDNSTWGVVILLAILVVGIGLTLAAAYQLAPSAIVATFDYSYLVFAVLFDYLFFSNPPSLVITLGIVLIVFAGWLATSASRETKSSASNAQSAT